MDNLKQQIKQFRESSLSHELDRINQLQESFKAAADQVTEQRPAQKTRQEDIEKTQNYWSNKMMRYKAHA